MSEDLTKQAHYEALSPQPIEVIKAWDLDFFLGNVVKYIGRCKTKGQEMEDLKKAKVYLQWKIDELQGEKPRHRYRLRPLATIEDRRCRQGGSPSLYWRDLPFVCNGPEEVAHLHSAFLTPSVFNDYYEEAK